jgi:two-component system, cell cycle sensor histidine kinase and response regulator CckA
MTLSPVRIALICLAAGSLWVVSSDWLLAAVAPGSQTLGQTLKGLLFVAAGSLVVYLLARRLERDRRAFEDERRELERRLGAVARLEAIGQLTGGIAHDFNNLLTAITGNIEAYIQQHPEREEVSEELREIRRSADRAADLTRQLLAFGRPRLDTAHPVDLNQHIRSMASLLHRLIGDRVRIRTELADHLRPVRIDPGRLEQVVMNLALNARDAMPGGGQLTLRTTDHQHRFIRLDVMDTGHGIEPELHSRIFEPYFTTKSEGAGTGLGLITVQSIVREAGGHITVASAPGSGAMFSVFLPRAGARRAPPTRPESPAITPADSSPLDEAPAATGAPSPTERGARTVLVAEDDPAVRSLVARVLRKRGFAVYEVAAGQDALDILSRTNGSVDILITDAMMPEMTGMELIEAARPLRPSMRTLLISGYPGDEFSPDIPYLAKPFTAAQLLDRIEDIMDD